MRPSVHARPLSQLLDEHFVGRLLRVCCLNDDVRPCVDTVMLSNLVPMRLL